MKIVYGILLFFSLCVIGVEFNTYKYYKRIKVQKDIDRYFVQDTMYYLNRNTADRACSTCHYYFNGVLKNNKDTVSVIGQENKYLKLLKNDNGRLYFNVWYAKEIKTAVVTHGDGIEKLRLGKFNLIFLRAWFAYIFMFCSIPLSILLFKKNKNEE